MTMEYVEMLKDFGPILGVILFFIWRDWKREDRMADRITALEKFQQDQLIELIERTNEPKRGSTTFTPNKVASVTMVPCDVMSYCMATRIDRSL